MRNTTDLVNEMLAEAKSAALVAIAVAFDNDTKFVFSSDLKPLAMLNRLVQGGGSPVGLLRFDKAAELYQGSYRTFEEYSTAEWAAKYLAGLLDHTPEILAMSEQQKEYAAAY